MKFTKIHALFIIILGLVISSCSQESHDSEATMSPGEFAEHVSDVIVEGTEFRFEPALQEFEQDGSYLVDFPSEKKGVFYARSTIVVEGTGDQDFGTYFGISHQAGTIKVQLNGNTIYSNSSDEDGRFNHVDYALYEFQDRVAVELPDGDHQLVIKFIPEKAGENRIYFSFIRTDNGLNNPAVTLSSPSTEEELEDFGYWWIGPLSNRIDESELMNPNLTASELVAQQYTVGSGDVARWDLPQLHLVKSFPGWLTYQNWHYSSGTFLDAMLRVSEQFNELDYTEYINQHLDFTLDNIGAIQNMRDRYGLIDSPFGHYYRFSLLDDMGMQTVPYVNRLITQKQNGVETGSVERNLVNRVTHYIMNDASRLEDGTFARYTPDSMSVWADDLYMGTIVLLKMSELTGDQKYLNEAAKQVIQFDEHLRDKASDIYWHGWFSRPGEHSSTKWGRANGWTMMAKTELLLAMPENHPKREQIVEIFSRQSEGLLAVQSEDGRWHQVLDDPSTYLETSATAMFVRAYARGVTEGWLEKEKYASAIKKGWASLTHQINEEGDVIGIVRGTPIMFSDEEYANWGTRKSDPRGLGALLYAAVAMDNYLALEN